jgi:hypothetical protein
MAPVGPTLSGGDGTGLDARLPPVVAGGEVAERLARPPRGLCVQRGGRAARSGGSLS